MGRLNWTRADFLDATLWDIYAAHLGYNDHVGLLLGIKGKKRMIPPTLAEVQEMMKRFPDK